MTTRTEIFEQAKSIATCFSETLEAPLFLATKMNFSDEVRINFGGSDVDNYNNYNKYCSISVTMGYSTREESDDVGFYTSQKVKISFVDSSSYGSSRFNLEEFGIRLPAYNKAYELMNLLVTELPGAVTERIETYTQRTDRLAQAQALGFCRRMAKDNSKHLRVESAKLLEAPPSELTMGEYVVRHLDKTYKVILSSSSTLLIRTA